MMVLGLGYAVVVPVFILMLVLDLGGGVPRRALARSPSTRLEN